VWQGTTPSRRLTSRVEALEDVWVYWQCSGREDVCRIRDLSTGGLFIEMRNARAAVGTIAKIEFLVREGQVRAEATVRRVEPKEGVGVKFTAIRQEDRPRLKELVTRLRSLQREKRETD
jgi:hypothetical protein